jgi:hypothetical protein
MATMAIGIPGLMMLARFVPIGVREPDLDMGVVGSAPRTLPR